MKVIPVGLVGLAAVAVLSCGGDQQTVSPPAATSRPPEVPVAPATVAPANTVIALTAQELLDLAREHRIKSATVYDNGIAGLMLSDVSSGQRFSSPRPGTAAALATLSRALTDGGATVATRRGTGPSP
ncbi:MAG: hypothetical protein ABR564_09620 [Candidatus Dormibacteria bacterium]